MAQIIKSKFIKGKRDDDQNINYVPRSRFGSSF